MTNAAVSMDESIFDGWSNDIIRHLMFDITRTATTDPSSSCQQIKDRKH